MAFLRYLNERWHNTLRVIINADELSGPLPAGQQFNHRPRFSLKREWHLQHLQRGPFRVDLFLKSSPRSQPTRRKKESSNIYFTLPKRIPYKTGQRERAAMFAAQGVRTNWQTSAGGAAALAPTATWATGLGRCAFISATHLLVVFSSRVLTSRYLLCISIVHVLLVLFLDATRIFELTTF